MYPAMGRDNIHSWNDVLGTLAQKPRAFESGSRLGRWQRFIYKCIPVKKENICSKAQTQTNKNQSLEGDVENLIGRSKNYSTKPFSFSSLRQITTTTFGSIYHELHSMFWNALVFLVPYIKFIHDQKLTHMQAIEIVRMICEGVTWNDPDSKTLTMSLHTAARFGISEIVHEIIMTYNRSVYWHEGNGSRGGNLLLQEEIEFKMETVNEANAVAGMAMANNTSDDEISDLSSCSNGDETTKTKSPKVSNQVNWSTYWPLCKMIQENDWKGVEDFVEKHPEALTVEITRSNRIFDHIFFFLYDDGEGVARLIEKLATKIDPITLEDREMFPRFTVLHLCAMIGNTSASKILVQCNRNLPNIRNNHDFLPVHSAAYYGHKDTVQYLIQETAKDNLQGRSGAHLISALIESNFYDLACKFLKQYPAMARDNIHSRNIVLGTLARKPLAFQSGSRLGCWQRFIYTFIPVKKENIFSMAQTQINKNQDVEGDVENIIGRSKNYSTKPFSFGSLRQITSTTFGSIYQELHRMFWNALVFLVPYIKFIHEQKLTHMQAIEIVRMICEGVTWNDPDSTTLAMSLHTAASFGISEIVNEITMTYNRSVYWINREGCNLFHFAILHRREKVFNLIYRTRFLNHMLVRVDQHGNNLLHLAGGLVPSSEIAGAALQMQRELQWFKAVENFIPPAVREKQNHAKRTPREVFTETHKELVKEGEKWMKETASSCTVAVTLIITVVFAAAFTVPGGNNANGFPNFLNNKAFLVFAVSDALALFSSTTSLLMFLGILTSRYSEDDFLVSLPRKLIIGLMTLFFSIASMLVAFCATIYIVLFNPWKWVIIPFSLLGCVPVTLFAVLQFPLLLDMFLSTYGPSIFRPKM